jgi:hypothetical protein
VCVRVCVAAVKVWTSFRHWRLLNRILEPVSRSYQGGCSREIGSTSLEVCGEYIAIFVRHAEVVNRKYPNLDRDFWFCESKFSYSVIAAPPSNQDI